MRSTRSGKNQLAISFKVIHLVGPFLVSRAIYSSPPLQELTPNHLPPTQTLKHGYTVEIVTNSGDKTKGPVMIAVCHENAIFEGVFRSLVLAIVLVSNYRRGGRAIELPRWVRDVK